MELINAGQIQFEDILKQNIDVLIFSASENTNSNYWERISLIPAKRKIFFANFNENEHLFDEFLPLQTEKILINLSDPDEFLKILDQLCKKSISNDVKLVIDYTFLSKKLLGTLISYISLQEAICHRMIIYFYYHTTQNEKNNRSKVSTLNLEPILSYESFKFNNRPVSLIIDLTNDFNIDMLIKAFEYFTPISIYFYFQQGNDKVIKRYNSIKKSNFKFLETIYEYDEKNIEQTDNQLRCLVRQLRVRNRVIILSLGSKTFTLVSFLLNSRYPDVEIWTLYDSDSVTVLPSNFDLVYKTEMIKDDAEDCF